MTLGGIHCKAGASKKAGPYHVSHQSAECETRKSRTVHSEVKSIDKRNMVFPKEPYLKWLHMFHSEQTVNRLIINGDKISKFFTSIEEFVSMLVQEGLLQSAIEFYRL
jgi:hypothetical protein